jgi:hypothetical protein
VLLSKSRLNFGTPIFDDRWWCLRNSAGVGGGAVEKEDEEEVVVVKVELEVEALKAALFVVAGWRLRPSTSQNLGRPER